MTGVEIFLAITFIAMGAMVQGCVGIGIGLVAAPVLVSIDPAFAPGPLLIAAQVVGIRHVLAERDHTDWSAVKHCLWGVPIGLAAGIAILLAVDERLMAIIVGTVTVIGCIGLLAGLRIPRSRPTEILTGALVALSSSTAGLPGPPLVATFADMKPAALRGTASSVILVVAAVTGISLFATGEFRGHEFRLLLVLLPGVAIGLLAARVLRPALDRPWFRTVVLVIAGLGGAALVIRQLV